MNNNTKQQWYDYIDTAGKLVCSTLIKSILETLQGIDCKERELRDTCIMI